MRSLDFADSVDDLSAEGPSPALLAPESIPFSGPLDTSLSVPEYPLISRALMLDGGSTDAVLDDFDGDGIDDLAVAVSEANLLSVFFGQPDGTFLSYPDRDVSLSGIPVALGVVDRYGNGFKDIVVLQRRLNASSYDSFIRVNTTTWVPTSPLTVTEGAKGLVIGNFTGTSAPEIVVVSEGSDPAVYNGVLQVFRGPTYADSFQIGTGLGTSSVTCGDYDGSGTLDVAVSNTYDLVIEVFLSPLEMGMDPDLVITTSSSPYGLVSGNFNGDSLTDLAVACQGPSSLQFFLQAESTGLPSTASLELSLTVAPSRMVQGDMNSDSKADLLVLSEPECQALGFCQGTSPIWSSTPSFHFPTGSFPRGALIGDLTGDDVADIGVTSARSDWTGSSMSVYPARTEFSNSNHTVWTAFTGRATIMGTGDLNGDGLEDLIAAIPGANAFGYMLGYSELGVRILGYAPDRLIVDDLDGDGLSDVLTSNITEDHAGVDFGDVGLPGTSTDPIELNCSGNLTDIVTGDFDDDGLMDVAAATAEGTVEIFFNTGSVPAFGEPYVVVVSASLPVMALAVGDFDSDGLDDLACTASSQYVLVILQKDAEDTISMPADYTLQATYGPVSRLWAGETTGDGDDDIIAMQSSGERLYVFDQDLFADIVANQTIDLPEAPSFITITDVTDDERSDLLVVYPSADLLFLYRQEGSSLPETPSMTFVTGAGPVWACLGDATGRGVGDLQVLDSQSESVSVFERIVLDVGPTAMFGLSVSEPTEGEPFAFLDESTGYEPIDTWIWTLTYPDLSNQTWDLGPEDMSEVMFVLGDGTYTMRLDVFEPDGDTDWSVLEFSVLEVAPDITLTMSPTGGIYVEFQTVTFLAGAESQDPVVLYEWDFDSPDDEFLPDDETELGEASHSYGEVGSYTVKVRATDSDGSVALVSVTIAVLDAGVLGTFEDDVIVTRDPDATNNITFDASSLASFYPDITSVLWEFGDGSSSLLTGPPSDPVMHTYAPVSDYTVNLTLADDDGNVLEISKTLRMIEPDIDLINPQDGSVVRSGTPITMRVGDDSLPLVSVKYSVNGGELMDFAVQYSISTDGWEDGEYEIVVVAEDIDGNIARKTVLTLIIDDTEPALTLLWEGSEAFGGDRLNITVQVDDASGSVASVILYVTFPGDDPGSQFVMQPAGDGVYYAVVEVPKREGSLRFSINATDLAGNYAVSEVYSVQVELRFMDAAWLYLLAIAVAAALGTGLYFMREKTIAVDETFVIYSDGRLLAHSTRRLKPGMDDQVLSGMFVAVQDFIKDSFKDETSFRLRKLDFGERSVLVEKGEHLFLAVVLHGKASKKVARRMKSVLDDIEDAFSEHLADWDGDLDKVRGVNDRVKRLYSRAPVLPGPLRRDGT